MDLDALFQQEPGDLKLKEISITELQPLLKKVQKPARYTGHELGFIEKEIIQFHFIICFPDLYELGMSNNAMKIIYTKLNEIDGLLCDRLFTPAIDYVNELHNTNIPLYGLDSLLPVHNCDILAFTIGYELAATNVLLTLELAGIPLKAAERLDNTPLIIAGGPGISNPIPFGSIFDAVWIGEAEDAFFDLCRQLVESKKNGFSRNERLSILKNHPSIWHAGKIGVIKNTFMNFSNTKFSPHFPFPALKPIQEHGVVEIMRGCPNGCRFCHAGYHYRPCRYKNVEVILQEVSELVDMGYSTITLSSLSSGDYPGILPLVRYLNLEYSSKGISFQLPSLKIETLDLAIISELSETRKGSLTFAIETPQTAGQAVINKSVTLNAINDILKKAKLYGYRTVKFYFMIGLPITQSEVTEEQAIVQFLMQFTRLPINITVTIATFVPKPFTPFENEQQLSYSEILPKIYYIKDALRCFKNIKITYHNPLMSTIEGIIARGDDRVGELIHSAYKCGCSFDAWDDLLNVEKWQTLLEQYKHLIFVPSESSLFPWAIINEGVQQKFIEMETKKAIHFESTSKCNSNCEHPCGACDDSLSVDSFDEFEKETCAFIDSISTTNEIDNVETVSRPRTRLILNFKKCDAAVFYAHHDLHGLIFHAMQKSGLIVEFSQGYNPLPRLEITEPMPLGFGSDDEYASAIIKNDPGSPLLTEEALLTNLQRHLPIFVVVKRVFVSPILIGTKIHSLSAIHWGSDFILEFPKTDISKITQFTESITKLLAESEIMQQRDFSVQKIKNSIVIALPFSGKKSLGITGLLSEGIGQDYLDLFFIGKRLRQYAMSPGDSAIKMDYLDFYKNYYFSTLV